MSVEGCERAESSARCADCLAWATRINLPPLLRKKRLAELDEQTLQTIAKQTGGKYFKSVDDKTLDDIYKNISKDIKREKEETNIKDWCFLIALIINVVIGASISADFIFSVL